MRRLGQMASMIIVGMPFARFAPRLTMGLATLLVWALAVGSAMFWWLQPGAVAPAGGSAVAGAAPVGGPAVDVAAVARALGAQPGGAAPAAPDVAARLALRGVLTHGRGGAALIAVDGQPAKPLRVGARLEGLDGDWKLRAVTPHAAVLAAGGRELRLELPLPDQRPAGGAPALPRPGVVAAPAAAPAMGMPGLKPLPMQ